MKKFILILLFCFIIAIPCYGQDLAMMVIGSGTVDACDDCSGTLIWASHFEGTGNSSTPFNITTNSPCGCSDNASKLITYYSNTANSNAQSSDGSYSFYRPGTGVTDYCTSPLTSTSTTIFSVQFDIYLVTGATGSTIFQIRYDVSNRIYVVINTDDFAVNWVGNGTTKSLDTASGTDWDMTSNTWHTIRMQGRVGTSPYIRATLDGGSVKTYTTADNTAMTNAPSIFYMGHVGTGVPEFYIDKVYIWEDWQTGTNWGD